MLDAHCHPLSVANYNRILAEWQSSYLYACSTNWNNFCQLKQLQSSHPNINISLGLHPWFVQPDTYVFELDTIEKELRNSDLTIGEVGLDYQKRYKSRRQLQRKVFSHFLDLASVLNRPIIIHCVKAHHELLALLKQYPLVRFYLHRFTGSPEIIKQYERYNCYFGIQVQQPIKKIQPPLNRVLVESDSLLPIFHFDSKINQLATQYGLTNTEFKSIVQQNANEFFHNQTYNPPNH